MPTYDVTIEGREYEVDAPDPKAAEQGALKFHGERKTRMESATAADIAKNKADFDKAERERPLLERVGTNIGAGMHNVLQGGQDLAKDWFGIGPGVSDEEIAEQRQMKADLASRTTGGGAIQIVGEALPTAVLPGGVAGGAVRRALTSGIAGGVSGALTATKEDESRAGNIAAGAVGGAAAPLVVRGAAHALPRALGGRAGLSTSTRAGSRLVEAVRASQGQSGRQAAEAVAQRLEAPNTSAITGDIPLTTAEKAGSTELARLELAARKELPEHFAEHGRRANEAIHEAATQRAGVEGEQWFVDMAKRSRDHVTQNQREEALRNAGRWSNVADPLTVDVQALAGRSVPGSPARGLADLVERTIAENPTPQQLYELRKLLASKLSKGAVPGDDVAAIVKGAQREAMEMIRAIDARLNEAARTKTSSAEPWSDYLRRYSEHSPKVTSSRAQQQINEALSAEGRPLVGNAPETTRAGLTRALEKFGSNRYGDRLTPDARSRYGELQEFLQAREEPMRALKLGGTGGGGSQTAMQQAANLMRRVVGESVTPGGSLALDAIMNKVSRATQEEVSQMMLDPSRAAAGIRAALQAGAPLSNAEKTFLQIARTGALAGGAGLSAPAAAER